MKILTIVNTLSICFILFHQRIIKVKIIKDITFYNNTLTGYKCWIMNLYFRIPIRNKYKTEINEEVHRLINLSKQSKFQILSAKFSWLKTWKEVKQFEKDYSIVDKKIIDSLVEKFVQNMKLIKLN